MSRLNKKGQTTKRKLNAISQIQSKVPTFSGISGVLPPTFQKRLMREIEMIKKEPLEFIEPDFTGENITNLLFYIKGPTGSLYEGETFTLRTVFTSMYPMECPIVVFVPPMVPKHEHIYSNGHICLSILYDQWTPSLGLRGILLSIVSLLSSAKEKKTPIDNRNYIKNAPDNPKETMWYFHDDTC